MGLFLEGSNEVRLIRTQRVNNVPAAYVELRGVALDCIQHIRFDEDARSVFETERVRRQLKCVMDLVIEVLEMISRYLAKSIISAFHL